MGKSAKKSKASRRRAKRKAAPAPALVARDLGPVDGIGPPAALVAVRAWLRVARGLLASRAGWTKTQARTLRGAKELPARSKMRTLLIRLQRRQALLPALEAAEVDRAVAAIRAAYAAEASALGAALAALQAAIAAPAPRTRRAKIQPPRPTAGRNDSPVLFAPKSVDPLGARRVSAAART